MKSETVTNPRGADEWTANRETSEVCPLDELYGPPPWQDEQEWANALTHGIAAGLTVIAGYHLVLVAATENRAMAIACGVYAASVFGTFLFSTLSHVIRRQPLLNALRAWDQAMIYCMIAGTYTPIIHGCASESVRVPLLAAIWIFAGSGFLAKVALRHRINAIGAVSYLLLGWLPSIPLAGGVPRDLALSMLAGGVIYTGGVILLLNDTRFKYLHACWHISVMTAAAVHYLGILYFVVLS